MTGGEPINPARSDADASTVGRARPAPRITEEQVNAFFDRELDPQHARELLGDLKGDASRSEEVARTQRMISLLRRAPLHGERAEELRIDAIMARVDRRRRFIPEAWRRFVTAGRLATAATILLAGLAVAVLGRTHPDALRLTPRSAPIASLINTTRAEAAEGAARCIVTFESIGDQAAAPFEELPAFPLMAGTVGVRDPLRAGVLATVRFSTDDRDLLMVSGSGAGDPSGCSAPAVSLGMEMAVSRQRCGASAPVFLPTLAAAQAQQASASPAAAGVTSTPGPISCQSVTVGDHVLVVPASFDPRVWMAGGNDVQRLLLFQASPPDLSSPR